MNNIGSSLESAISSLRKNVESAKNVATQISKQTAEEEEPNVSVNSDAETVGSIVDVEA